MSTASPGLSDACARSCRVHALLLQLRLYAFSLLAEVGDDPAQALVVRFHNDGGHDAGAILPSAPFGSVGEPHFLDRLPEFLG